MACRQRVRCLNSPGVMLVTRRNARVKLACDEIPIERRFHSKEASRQRSSSSRRQDVAGWHSVAAASPSSWRKRAQRSPQSRNHAGSCSCGSCTTGLYPSRNRIFSLSDVRTAASCGLDFADTVYMQFLASSIEKILCEARGSGPAEFATILLPNCSVRSRTGQHLAKAMLENEQLIETYWYGIVREVIPIAEFRVRCFQPLSHLAWAKREPWPTTCLRGPKPITPLSRPLDNVKSVNTLNVVR